MRENRRYMTKTKRMKRRKQKETKIMMDLISLLEFADSERTRPVVTQ
jgi:hypothetical protein